MSSTSAVRIASCGRCGTSFSTGGGFCEHCGTPRVAAAAVFLQRRSGSPALSGTTRTSESTVALTVALDAIPIVLVVIAAIVLAVLLTPAWLVLGLLVVAAVVLVQALLLSRRGRTLGRYATSTRTVDDLTGLPLRYRNSFGALVGRRSGSATIELRTGRDPLVPAASTPGGAGQTGVVAVEATDAASSTPLLSLAAHTPAATAPAEGVGVALLLDSGQRVIVESTLVLGRNPASPDAAALYSWPDLSRSLSKNHALLAWTGAILWVSDLGSTNGTAVVGLDGSRVALAPGERVAAPVGSRIELGTRSVTVAEVVS
jgi:FHA domain